MKKIKYSKKFKSKPSYDLYIQLGYTLDMYGKRINEYIFFEYYKGKAPKIKLIKKLSINDWFKVKKLYEYDYQVFKTLLFLYGDLECYLENIDYVKQTLKVDYKEIYNIIYKNKVISNIEYYNKILTKKPINLGTNLEIHGMFDKILKYDLYSKIDNLDIILYAKYPNYINLINYKDLILLHENDFHILRLIQFDDEKLKLSYYESYIEMGHKEGYSEINQDLTSKYKSKIKVLDIELKNLLEC